jgi:hypothetical protein
MENGGTLQIVYTNQWMPADELPTPEILEPLDHPPRLRFWEIEPFFKCPVIGWCLDVAEQREVLRKEGTSNKDQPNFKAHEMLVQNLESENRLSSRVDCLLNRKYKKEIAELSSLEEGEFIRCWKDSLKRGDVEGMLWVGATKPDLSIEAKRIIFGDVHMEMHVRAKQISDERQKLDQEWERNELLAESVKDLSRINRVLKKENEKLRDDMSKACRLSDALQRQKRELEEALSKANESSLVAGFQKENADLRSQQERISEEISAYQRELRILQNQKNKLLLKLKKQSQIHPPVSKESESVINQLSALPQQSPAPSLDLSQRCVLVVGGLSKMEPLYRQLIEGGGGVFEYHNGRMNAGTRELVNQVRRADVVLCCIDHNSHAAALAAKKLGKKHKKPVRMLASSSLNNIFSTLTAAQGAPLEP